ncbi:alpha/beta fold hydrolase [Erythrobacter oryzae]|uniref:alpha/beta fold hydrolase n=1 Tax=Erythrobacter oryzae TaxID=3019556 RepID=UPI0025566AC1|nr:alpha/beta fold hydrolase [Erythrobacter sp. COR-2]
MDAAITEPQTFSADLDGQTVAYLKAGHGPALVIIHGLGGHKEDFGQVVQLLGPHYTVYAPDMLGFGGSSRDAPSVGPNAQAAMVRALLDHEGIAHAHIAGNSAGGWAAAVFAQSYPERIGKLALIDVAGLSVTLSGPPPVNFAPDTVEEMHQLLSVTIASPFAQTQDFASQALAAFKASGEAASLGKLFAGFSAPDNADPVLDDVLPNVHAPTLVVWGEKDGLFPAALADMVVSQLPPGATKVIIPEASHFSQIDDPDALARALADFFG